MSYFTRHCLAIGAAADRLIVKFSTQRSRHAIGRAAANTMLKNWGKVLADVTAALDCDVLPPASALRASRRGANAAFKLRKTDEARTLHRRRVRTSGEPSSTMT